jgi:tetratricopeptide (TPR) repeat protein
MKKLLIVISILICHSAFAQKMPSDYFDEASKYLEDDNYEKALSGYQYIVDNFPKNELYPKSHYNIGYIYYTQKKFDKAIPIFKTILESNFNEKENLGGGIMDDPYTNYRHRASEILSNIYYDQKMYDTALQYFALSDTAYPYLHFCGNEYASNDVHTALRYSDIYQKLNQPDKAIESLLPTVFITLADNSKVIDELKKLLSDKKNLKKELEESLNKIYSKKTDKTDYSFTRYYFTFLNTEIAVPDSYEDDKKKFEKEKAIKEIRQTEFYKMIQNL